MASQWLRTRNLLLVRLDNLGDVLLCTPAFHAVRETLPQARLTLLASAVGAQTAELNPDIDDVIVYEAPWMDVWRRRPQDSAKEQEIISLLRERRFDGAIIFTSFRQSPLPAAYLCYLADIPLRLAASIDGPGALLTTRHRHPERLMHEVERALDLVAAEGFHTTDTGLVLQVPEGERSAMKERLVKDGLGSCGPLVVIHPGCSMPARTYPWEMFAEVGDLLAQRLDARVILTGTEGEVDLVERILNRMASEARSLAGATSFRELATTVAAADIVITNNTGPAHVAAAVGTPVIDLFALTNPPEQWRPWTTHYRLLNRPVPCALCYSRVCPYKQECLTGVSPEDVLQAAKELLQETTETRGEIPRGVEAGL